MEEQSGRLISKDSHQVAANTAITNSKNPIISCARTFYHNLENHPIFGKLFIWNKLYPFENLLKAIKR